MFSSGKWIMNLFATVFTTMVVIYIIKYAASRYQIPIVKDIAEGV